MRLMIVGTLPPPICGTTVSLRHLIQDIQRRHTDVSLKVLNTGSIRGSGWKGFYRLLSVLFQIVWHAPRADTIALHLNPYAIPTLGTFSVCVSKIFGCRLLIRLFGGNCFTEYGGIRGWFFRFALRNAATYFAQTHELVNNAKSNGMVHVEWFPTSRPAATQPFSTSRKCRKLIYVGWVSSFKGIPELIEAGKRLSFPGVSIDVYGPLEGLTESDFSGQDIVTYKGILPPGTAAEKMTEYDALVFPSHYIGEGYPGTVIEAFHAGLPILATDWRYMPELVDQTCGILFPPSDADAIRKTIESLAADDQRFLELQSGARARSKDFLIETWTDRFLEFC